MTSFIKKHSAIIWALILVAMLVLTWLFPTSRFMIEAAFLLTSFVIASFVVIVKNKESYLQGKLTQGIFARNTILDIFGILLAMTFAGLLANYIIQISIRQIGNDLAKFIVGIVTGLLIGIGIGVIMKRIRGWVVTISSK